MLHVVRRWAKFIALLFALILSLLSISARSAQAGGGSFTRLTFPGAYSASCGSWRVDGHIGTGQADALLVDGAGTVLFQQSYTNVNLDGVVGSGFFKNTPKKNPITFSFGPLSIAADNPCLPSSGMGRIIFIADGALYSISSVPTSAPSKPVIEVRASDAQPLFLPDFTARVSEVVRSPHGTRVAFIANFDNVPQVFNSDLVGSDNLKLTTDNAGKQNVAWSPDGQKLAYSEDVVPPTKSGPSSLIHILSADGKTNKTLKTTVSVYSVSWSPDGKTLAFWSYSSKDNSRTIYTINVDGTHQQKVVSSDSLDANPPIWSPDGQQLLYADVVEHTFGIYVVNIDGSNQHVLVSDKDADSIQPVWAPDGKHIAFQRGGRRETTCNVTAYVMNADGSNPTAVSDRKIACGLSIGAGNLAWSPDSQHIAFAAFEPDSTEQTPRWAIVVGSLDGSPAYDITQPSLGGVDPIWQP